MIIEIPNHPPVNVETLDDKHPVYPHMGWCCVACHRSFGHNFKVCGYCPRTITETFEDLFA